MVIDRSVVITGSFNYTGPANILNDENILIIGNLDETDPQAITIQQRFADFAIAEMTRIQNQH